MHLKFANLCASFLSKTLATTRITFKKTPNSTCKVIAIYQPFILPLYSQTIDEMLVIVTMTWKITKNIFFVEFAPKNREMDVFIEKFLLHTATPKNHKTLWQTSYNAPWKHKQLIVETVIKQWSEGSDGICHNQRHAIDANKTTNTKLR